MDRFASHEERGLQRQLALALFDTGALCIAASPTRSLFSFPPDALYSPALLGLASQCIDRLQKRVCDENRDPLTFSAVAGVPDTGSTVATAFAEHIDVPYLPLRKKAGRKDCGFHLAGPAPARGRKVLVVDAIVRETETKQAADALLGRGLWVSDIVTLIDGTKDAKLELGIWGAFNLYAVFQVGPLLTMYREAGKIGHEQHRSLQAFAATMYA